MAKLTIKNMFGVAPNRILNSPDLSFKAKGLFAYIQSKPDGWEFSAERISSDTNDGVSAVKAGLRELQKAGCLKRVKYHDKKGYWNVEYILTDELISKSPAVENPPPDNPTMDFRAVDNPAVDNPMTENIPNNSKKEFSKKELNNKEKLKIPENKFSVVDFSDNSNSTTDDDIQIVEVEEINSRTTGSDESNPPKKSSAKKSTPKKSAHPAFGLIKKFWFEDFHPDWIFKPIDGKKINSLIQQFEKIIQGQDGDATPQGIENAFRVLCQNLPEWYKTKDLAIIDSKLNTIITEIKNNRYGKSTSTNFRDRAYAAAASIFDE